MHSPDELLLSGAVAATRRGVLRWELGLDLLLLGPHPMKRKRIRGAGLRLHGRE